mmetsp:Transcript_16240/g.26487  ORF Transcript_16240/g.26487 Transcript_16240/m.26487 type:complete len:282 (-) Transcript_16240:1603-2448(-)
MDVYGFFVDAFSGTVGGACCVLVGHPFDTAKVLMQTGGHGVPKSTLGCMSFAVRSRGIVNGLYAGGGASLAANASENAVLFMSYGQISNWSSRVSENAFVRGAVAGSLASFVASFVLCPIELCKIRSQMGIQKMDLFRSARLVVREKGLLGLYEGYSATLMREVPGNIGFFGVYEYSKMFLEKKGWFYNTDLRVMVSGGLGGIGFWLISMPADAVKTRQQAFSGSLFGTVSTIFRTSGVRGFYAGLAPAVIRAFPANAALFWGVEKSKQLLSGKTITTTSI